MELIPPLDHVLGLTWLSSYSAFRKFELAKIIFQCVYNRYSELTVIIGSVMAAAIPTPLKQADIARFAHRAGQLEKAKPVVAYYCSLVYDIPAGRRADLFPGYYWILDQIIAKGLHNTDNECKTYTTNLMDKLEQMKVDYAENNAITDDMAGHAYVEQFGQETFQRADKTMNANKVTRQTADTFQAAATFLDLVQIWGPLDPEIASKIKYAKYHALRIAKALKAGEDPNLSNPVPEPNPEDEPPLDPNDPEVQAINGTDMLQGSARQPSVEEVPDEQQQVQSTLAQRSTADESLHPTRAPSVPPQQEQHQQLSPPEQGEDYYANTGAPDVSPLVPSSAERKSSTGGGYFPTVPNAVGQPPSFLPDAPPVEPGSPRVLHIPNPSSLPPPPPPGASAPSLHSFPPPNIESTLGTQPPTTFPPHNPYATPLSTSNFQSAREPPTQPPPSRQQGPGPNSVQSPVAPSAASATQPTVRPPNPIPPTSQVYQADEEAILKAQKHARWAISALNFEDVKTAVNELKGALASLGAA